MRKKNKVYLLICIMLLTSGCGNNDYLLDDKGDVIVSEQTGQQLRNDILCKPSENTEIYDIYYEYESQLSNTLEKLPECENFSINSNESESLWELIFVKPTAYAITKFGKFVGNLGIAVILVGIIIRIILLPLQVKTSKQSYNMKKANPELKKLEKKYEGKTDQNSQLMKSQEMIAIYKKYNINPLTGCIPAIIQLPIFFAFLNAIYRLPSIYEQTLLGFNLGMTPLTGINNGEFEYVLLMALIAASTYLSFKFTMSQNPQMTEEAQKQTKTMLNFMTVFILFSSLMFPTALHFYWIITYIFIAIQTKIINMYLEEKKDKKTSKKTTNNKLKIKDRLDKKEGNK